MKEQEIRRKLASKLQELRKNADMSAKEVGEKIGKSEKTVSAWEHGRGQPDADMLFELCDLYGVKSIAEFFPDQEEEELSLSFEETELVEIFRKLNKSSKDLLLTTARAYAGNPAMLKEETNAALA